MKSIDSRSPAYGRVDTAALVLVGLVAVVVASTVTPDASSPPPVVRLTSNGLACPLTPMQELKAGTAFEKMMPAITHPRCFNCHGGIDEKLPFADGGHVGGAAGPDDCKDCHTGVRNLRRPDRLADWSTPPSMFFFAGKTSREICNQFKQIELNPEMFIGHMVNENGGVQFTEVAYRGDRNLNTLGRGVSKEELGRDMVPEPPPIPHSELIAHAREWANTVGVGGWRIPDCGCRLNNKAWEGKVTTVFTQTEPGLGTLTETMTATVRFEIDSSFMVPGETALFWKTTSGLLKWTVNAKGGVCTAAASGSAPVRLGSDDNPWGSIRIDPDSSGGLTYFVTNGPWPEAYVPRFIYRCSREVKTMPGVMYSQFQWWNHQEGAKVSPDGQSIKGTFSAPNMLGTIRWEWDFKLVQ